MTNNLVRHSLLTATIAGSALVVTSTLLANPASAATATANLNVSATVPTNCSISTSDLAFGSYDPAGANASAPLNGTGSVTTKCTVGASPNITLGQGANSDTGSTDAAPLRRLKDGGSNYLSYSLYQDAGRTAVWGNTPGTGVGTTGTGVDVGLNIYGRISGSQNVPAGSYSDTVVATVTF